MVYVVVETWFPAAKAAESGKVYLEAMKKYPEDRSISKPIIRSMINSEREGLHAFSVYEIKPGKVKESLDLANNRMLMLATVEGYKYTIRLYYSLAEVMPFVGLQAPE